MVGAAGMVAFGGLPLDAAMRAIDLRTLTLLTAMMIVVGQLRIAGFFRLAADAALGSARSPLALLAATVLVTGGLSAILVNDAICIAMAPLVIELARRIGRSPTPYLLAVALASNAGSVATLTGNPQNMIVGTASGIPFAGFAAALAPIAAVSLAAVFVAVALVRRKDFAAAGAAAPVAPPSRGRPHLPQVAKTLTATAAIVVAFFAGVPVAEAAALGAAALLVTRAVKPEKVYRQIDGPLLLMFAGLFVVAAGAERAFVGPDLRNAVAGLGLDDAWTLTGASAVLSNVVSNVPAVLVLKPFVGDLVHPTRAWLVIAMATTLSGNLTLLGSVANLIVAERARAEGAPFGFREHLAVGLPVTLATLAFGAWALGRGF
ncbi:MAG: anion transporter [Hyphomicrobiales bacterium]|nr:anion transporter [Hyphomicrobiales bacterium]